jgi:Uma2 family endonuclease
MTALTLNLDRVHLSDEPFYQLCQNNRELQFERTARGELMIRPTVGGDSGNREADLMEALSWWQI